MKRELSYACVLGYLIWLFVFFFLFFFGTVWLISWRVTDVGFVISGKKILTNAHVVADHTFMQVIKHGSPAKYIAKVQAVGHECDLAILKIGSKGFWKDMKPLDLGDVPSLHETVSIVGYPKGMI